MITHILTGTFKLSFRVRNGLKAVQVNTKDIRTSVNINSTILLSREM